MDNPYHIDIPIPDDLDEVIQRGFSCGKATAARRARTQRLVVRSVCSVALAMGLFIGGIRVSPAFAAAMGELPVIGELVQIFGKNEPLAQGGNPTSSGQATLTMERSGTTEQMRLEFQQADASQYRAEFASYPKTVTITLPGTTGVEILSQISRTTDTSQYIKSVCQLPTSTPETTVLQLELESDADVQIQEYRQPGSLVIELTPADIQLNTIYSLRTLSFTEDTAAEVLSTYSNQSVRILRDDAGTFFAELGQYPTREEAEAAGAALPGNVLVEQRTGNNVPVAFQSMGAYKSSRFLDEFYDILMQSDTVAPVLDFMDQHFSQATPEEQEVLLSGLKGFLEDETEDTVNWEKAASFFRQAGETLPESIQQHLAS